MKLDHDSQQVLIKAADYAFLLSRRRKEDPCRMTHDKKDVEFPPQVNGSLIPGCSLCSNMACRAGITWLLNTVCKTIVPIRDLHVWEESSINCSYSTSVKSKGSILMSMQLQSDLDNPPPLVPRQFWAD